MSVLLTALFAGLAMVGVVQQKIGGHDRRGGRKEINRDRDPDRDVPATRRWIEELAPVDFRRSRAVQFSLAGKPLLKHLVEPDEGDGGGQSQGLNDR